MGLETHQARGPSIWIPGVWMVFLIAVSFDVAAETFRLTMNKEYTKELQKSRDKDKIK